MTPPWPRTPGNVRTGFRSWHTETEHCPGITEEDKKDLVHWMAYRERRPPSPGPQEILEKIRDRDSGGTGQPDRFTERKLCEDRLSARKYLDPVVKSLIEIFLDIYYLLKIMQNTPYKYNR